jgi:hypothetical protein
MGSLSPSSPSGVPSLRDTAVVIAIANCLVLKVTIYIFLEEKSGNNQAKRKVEGKPNMPKPEEQEGMQQHPHCPHVKHREDENPKYHEERLKDVEGFYAAHPPKSSKRTEVYRCMKHCMWT